MREALSAVSDQWEPLLRDVMKAAEIGLAFIEDDTLYDETLAAIDRARIALGETG